MKLTKEDLLLYAVTDRTWLKGRELKEVVEEAIEGSITFLQLREKDLTFDDFVQEAKEIKKITDKHKIPFVINDNVDVALAVDADGVHIGQSDEELTKARKKLGNGKIIGVSSHSVEEAIKAEANGADYLGVGAMFGTTSKDDAVPVTMEELKNICNSVSIPVVAIGGISKENIIELKGTNISGVAVISAIFAKENIKEASRELIELSKKVSK